MLDERGNYCGRFDTDKWWNSRKRECPYEKGYKCGFTTDLACEGCRHSKKEREDK